MSMQNNVACKSLFLVAILCAFCAHFPRFPIARNRTDALKDAFLCSFLLKTKRKNGTCFS